MTVMKATLESAIGIVTKNVAKDLELAKAKAIDSSDHIMWLPPCNGLVNASVPRTRRERRKLEMERKKEMKCKGRDTRLRIRISKTHCVE